MSLHALANHMAAQGRNNDSMLVHMTPKEVNGLHALAIANGGQLTINPETGLPEAGFLQDILPAIVGFGLDMFLPGLGETIGGAFGLSAAAGTGIAVGGLTGLATGNLSKGVMAGFGAYGGAGLAEGLMGAGASSVQNAAEAASSPGSAHGAFMPAEGVRETALASASPMDKLTAGFSATTQNPSALWDYAKGNWKYGIAAAAPALAGLSEEDQTVTKMPSTGMITPFVMNVKNLPLNNSSTSGQQKYLSHNVTPITPFKAANGGAVQHFRMGGINPEYTDSDIAYEMPDIAAQKALMRAQRQQQQAALDPAFVAPPEGEMGMQVVVYGPDGTMYGSPGAARQAGVTNYTMDRPTTDPYTQQFLDKAKTYKNTMTGESAKAFDYLMGNTRPTAQTTGRTSGSNSRGTVRAPVGMQTPAVPASAEGIQALADIVRGTGGSGGSGDARGVTTTAAAGDVNSYTNGALPAILGLQAVPAPVVNLSDSGYATAAQAESAQNQALAAQYGMYGNPSVGLGGEAGSSTGPNAGAVNGGESGGWGSRDAGGGTAAGPSGSNVGATSQGSAPGASASSAAGGGEGSGRGSGGDGGGGQGPGGMGRGGGMGGGGMGGDGGGGGGDGGGGGQARGGLNLHGHYYPPSYADGGVTGGGNIDLHVPINIGGGSTGAETFGGGFGGGNGIQQGGMPQQPGFGGLAGLLGQLQSQAPQAPQAFAQQATDEMAQQQQFMQPFGGINAQAPQQQQAMMQGLGKQNQAFGGAMGGTRYGAFAEGGVTGMADGGLGSLGGYSDGGRLLRGPGDGVSDSIPATIGQHQPARLADGEFVVPARIVSELGNGSTEAGARQLYAMMDRIQSGRKKTVGKNKVAANTRAAKHLPA
ncbi:hypothetical protein UFOVP654_41 [uncultured Caudovirales phage]|uniref:Uncharacterized protein n=1 Tax=uncultured Caudovirales phage TaxID=2100421 RepID=A0A6J5NCJ2_9CAUD|nr:hypothetical protein UFOVP654_41 [uncultured Caudovirales phage]